MQPFKGFDRLQFDDALTLVKLDIVDVADISRILSSAEQTFLSEGAPASASAMVVSAELLVTNPTALTVTIPDNFLSFALIHSASAVGLRKPPFTVDDPRLGKDTVVGRCTLDSVIILPGVNKLKAKGYMWFGGWELSQTTAVSLSYSDGKVQAEMDGVLETAARGFVVEDVLNGRVDINGIDAIDAMFNATASVAEQAHYNRIAHSTQSDVLQGILSNYVNNRTSQISLQLTDPSQDFTLVGTTSSRLHILKMARRALRSVPLSVDVSGSVHTGQSTHFPTVTAYCVWAYMLIEVSQTNKRTRDFTF